jgi:hypothetical protein
MSKNGHLEGKILGESNLISSGIISIALHMYVLGITPFWFTLLLWSLVYQEVEL